MDLQPSSQRLFRVALVATLIFPAFAALPVFTSGSDQPASMKQSPILLWVAAYVGFGAAFWLASRSHEKPRPRILYTVSLLVQTSLVLAMIQLLCTGFEGALLVVVAAQLGALLPLQIALSGVAVQSLVMGWVISLHWPLQTVVALSGAWLGFQVFAVLMSRVAASEASARSELAQANAQLRATQQLLSDSSRVAERVRISRELHDVLGHHLTGLSLNLEVATHVADDKAREHIQKAQSVTKLLLSDVRNAVSSLRDEESLDVGRALQTLVHCIRKPRIHLEVPIDLGIYDPVRAEILLRCVQEIITNAVRHSFGENLWIVVTKTAADVEVHARDDGRGAKVLRTGNGLRGMRERLEHVGGRLQIETQPARGFKIDAWIPVPGSSS